MKVGDLVRPTPLVGDKCATNAPIVQEEWVGLIIDFQCNNPGIGKSKQSYPVVYWNPTFQAEVEFPEQIEVVQCKSIT